jgi:hypothetical protein
MVEPEAVLRLVDNTKSRLDELHTEYSSLHRLAYGSEAETRMEEEYAKSSLVPVWKEPHQIIKAANPDMGIPSKS